jgi:hypothetical protein
LLYGFLPTRIRVFSSDNTLSYFHYRSYTGLLTLLRHGTGKDSCYQDRGNIRPPSFQRLLNLLSGPAVKEILPVLGFIGGDDTVQPQSSKSGQEGGKRPLSLSLPLGGGEGIT